MIRSKLILAVFSFSALSLAPSLISHIDGRGLSSRIRFEIRTDSPAYSALEDIRMDLIGMGDELEPTAQEIRNELLLAGVSVFKPNNVQALPPEKKEDPILLAKVQTKSSSVPTLRGMRISSQSTRESFALAQPLSTTLDRHESLQPKTVQLSRVSLSDERGELANMAVRKERLAQYLSDYRWTPPSVAERAQEIIESTYPELLASGGTIIRPSNPPFASQAEKSGGGKTNSKTEPPSPSWAPARVEEERIRPILLTGSLEMTGGLAFTGHDNYLTITWQDKGQVEQSGQVWVRDARFEVRAKALSGYLVAELRASSGEILGRGELDLYDVPTPKPHEVRVDDIRLKLSPVNSGLSLKVISADSFDRYELPVANPSLWSEEGDIEFSKESETEFVAKDILPASSMLVRAKAEGYWGSSLVGSWGADQNLMLLSESKVNALIGLVLSEDERRRVNEMSIVWGRVYQGSNLTAGAEVELAGDSEAVPVYFNEAYLPDRNLTKTSSNGMFAFILVQPGLHSVRAKVAGSYVPAQIISADRRNVSYVELEAGSFRSAALKVFDLQNPQQRISTTVSILGTDAELDTDGQEMIQYMSGRGQMVIEAVAEDSRLYEPSRIVLDRNVKSIAIPIVNREWIASLEARKRVNLSPGSGKVVGLVEDTDFEVFVESGGEPLTAEVIYFDQDKNLHLEKGGPAGGGFIISNLPEGLVTILIAPKGENRLFSRVVPSDMTYLSVLTFKRSQH